MAVPFTVNYNPSGRCEGTIQAWPAGAQSAFEYAVSIWAALINGSQTIEIDACWRTDLKADVLGSSWSRQDVNFPNAPLPNTYYPATLVNQLEGTDGWPDQAEIHIDYNANFSWYFGLDGNTPEEQHDFVSVVLHEIVHGLGFYASMNYDDGVLKDGRHECDGTAGHGCYGTGSPTPYPAAYDRFLENGGGTGLLTYASPSAELGTQLVGDSLYFDGPNARAANGGDRPRLYAPSGWDPGSSISHLDEDTYNPTTHALMTPALARGESVHRPGWIALGILEDVGWDVLYPPGEVVFVDKNNTGPADGTSEHPFNTVMEGVNALFWGGDVWIRPGTYAETMTINKAMTIRSTGGTVTIGQ